MLITFIFRQYIGEKSTHHIYAIYSTVILFKTHFPLLLCNLHALCWLAFTCYSPRPMSENLRQSSLDCGVMVYNSMLSFVFTET